MDPEDLHVHCLARCPRNGQGGGELQSYAALPIAPAPRTRLQLLRMPDARSVIVDPNSAAAATRGSCGAAAAAAHIRRPPVMRRSFSASCTPSASSGKSSLALRSSNPQVLKLVTRRAPVSERGGVSSRTRSRDGDSSRLPTGAESTVLEAGSDGSGPLAGVMGSRRSFGMRVINFLHSGAAGRKAPPGLLPMDSTLTAGSRDSDDEGSDEGEGAAPPTAGGSQPAAAAITWQERLAHSWPKVRGLTDSNSKLVRGLYGCTAAYLIPGYTCMHRGISLNAPDGVLDIYSAAGMQDRPFGLLPASFFTGQPVIPPSAPLPMPDPLPLLQVIFRGLRVRMGVHSGIADPQDVTVDPASNQTSYSGKWHIPAAV